MKNKYCTYSISNYLDFSMITVPSRVEKLIFEEDFTGDLPALYDFWNLKELVIKVAVSWEYISELSVEGLRSLSFVVDDAGPICPLKNDSLEHLTIYNISKKNLTPIEKIINSSILTGYDFSALPALKSLSLDYFLGFDFNKTKLPKSLESLHITNSDIKNVDWCLTVKNLKAINLDFNAVKDVKLLSYMPILERLSMRGNDIEIAKDLANIEHLNFLNLLGNPILDETSLRNALKTDVLILNQRDYEMYMLRSEAARIQEATEEFLYHYDRFVGNRSTFLQMQNLQEKSMNEEKRIQRYNQLSFERLTERIDPFYYDYSHYTSDYKKIFMEFAKKNNPNLVIKDRFLRRVYQEADYEKKGVSHSYSSEVGGLFFVNDSGLYRLSVQKDSGTGKLHFDERIIPEKLKQTLVRSVILNLCKTEQQALATSFDYQVHIETVYGKKPDSGIALGMIIGIFSTLNRFLIPSDLAFYGQLNTRGSLKKTEINQNILALLEHIGIKRTLIGKTTKKSLSIITDAMRLNLKLHCCNKTEELLEFIRNLSEQIE